MEIRPYRSQVRSTPTLEPVNNTVPNAGYAYQAFGDMISKTGQGASSQMYQWNDAIQKRQTQDRKIAYAAGVQEMDVLFAELGKTMSDNMAQSEQDPYNAFSSDTKNALNQTYSYNVNQIREKTVGKAPDAETQAMLDLYFRQKKLEAGAVVEAAIKTHTDKVAALVMGKANAGLVETAINGDEKDIDNSLKGIQNNLNILAERGVISQAQILTDLDSAKKQINFGRAKNQIDALDYKQGQEFINKIDIDDESRKKLQDYHKDKWNRQRNVILYNQGEVYNQGIDLYNNGQLTREWIDGQDVFKTRPELGLNTDYRTFFRGLLDAKEKLAAQEAKEEAAAQKAAKAIEEQDTRDALYRDYYNRIDNILIGNSDEDRDKLREEIKNNPDLKNQQVEHLVGLLNGTISRSGTSSGGRGMNNYRANLSEFYEILLNGANTTTERKRQFAEWFPKFIEKNPDAAEDLTWFDSMIEKADKLFTLPEVKVLQADVEKKIKAYQDKGDVDRATDLINASGSFFQVLAETMWWKNGANGERVETSEAEREKIFNEAKERLTLLTSKDNVIDALSGITLSGNNPYFVKTKAGYAMRIDGQYDTMRDTIAGSKWFRYTPQGISIFGQLENIDKQAIEYVTGEDMSSYEQRIVDDKPYYYSPATKMAFTIDRNKKGDWNVYRVMGNGELWVKTPPNIQEYMDFEAEHPDTAASKPEPTFVSQLGTGEKKGKDLAEAAGSVAKKVGHALNEGRKYVVKKTQQGD